MSVYPDGEESKVDVVELTPVGARGSRRTWLLELDEHEVRLLDDRDRIALVIPRDEAERKIHLPSFWLSVKYVQFYRGSKLAFEFLSDKEAVQRIRAYQDSVLQRDSSARSKLKQSGVALFLMGLFLLVCGVAFVTVEVMRGTLLHPDYLRTSSPFAAILFGCVAMGLGFGLYLRAVRAARAAASQEADPD